MKIKVQLVKAREKISVPPDLTSGITSVFSDARAHRQDWGEMVSHVASANTKSLGIAYLVV
jgi:hypothetical protein